jgi:hypothetical protein
MVRAQGQIADRFSAIIGERRGLNSGQAHLSSAPQIDEYHLAYFAVWAMDALEVDDLAVAATAEDLARRRMVFIRWLIDEEELGREKEPNNDAPWPFTVKLISNLDFCYQDGSNINGSSPTASSRFSAAQTDINNLLKQGIIQEHQTLPEPQYVVTPFEEWPKPHRESFERWRKAGGPHPR